MLLSTFYHNESYQINILIIIFILGGEGVGWEGANGNWDDNPGTVCGSCAQTLGESDSRFGNSSGWGDVTKHDKVVPLKIYSVPYGPSAHE